MTPFLTERYEPPGWSFSCTTYYYQKCMPSEKVTPPPLAVACEDAKQTTMALQINKKKSLNWKQRFLCEITYERENHIKHSIL